MEEMLFVSPDGSKLRRMKTMSNGKVRIEVNAGDWELRKDVSPNVVNRYVRMLQRANWSVWAGVGWGI